MNPAASSYRLEVLDKLASVLAPLSSELSLNGFGYRLFSSSGKSFGICSNNDWNNFFEGEFLPQHNRVLPYEEEVTQALKKGKYYKARSGTPESNDTFSSMLFKFDVWNSLCIYYKNTDTVEGFYFTSSKENKGVINFYLNNLRVLERYASYFKEKFSEVTNIEDLKKLSEPTLNAEVFALENLDDDQEIKLKSFSQSISLNKLVINKEGQSIVLSKREAECLCYMAFGKTMKEIASCLNLSPRTVEFYVDNMKKKTGLCSKSQLLNMFFNNLNEWPVMDVK